MHKRDERLIDFHRIINEQHSAKYQSVISAQPFARLNELLDWLEKQIPSQLPGQHQPRSAAHPTAQWFPVRARADLGL